MDPTVNFKTYIYFSIGLHALLLVLLIMMGGPAVPPPEPATVVTMIRLTRGTGTFESPLLKKGSPDRGPVAPPTPAAPPPPAPVPPKPAVPPPPVPAPVAEQKPPPKPKEAAPTAVQLKKPAKLVPPAPPVAPAPPAAPTSPAAPAPPQPPSPEEQKMAEALGQIKNELESREKQSQANAGGQGTAEAPGQEFGSPSGEISPHDPAYARYQSQVRSKIIREWIRANTGMETEPIRTRVVVRINASGAVISTAFAKRSGNASFDLSAVRAIERASPLPPPPPILMAEALNEGFVVDFSSRLLGR